MNPTFRTDAEDTADGYAAPELTPLGDVLDAAATTISGTLGD